MKKKINKSYKDKIIHICKIHYIFITLLILLSLFSYSKISELQQLPSPIYGGDLYYHLGGMINLREGNSYLDNPQMNNEDAWTPPLYNWFVVSFAKATGLELIKANLYSSIIILIATMLISYLIGLKLFNDRYVSLLFSSFFIASFPVLKYLQFTMYLFVPLMFYFFYRYYKNPNNLNAILAGIGFGLIGISHLNIFIGFAFFLIIFFTFHLYAQLKDLEKKKKDSFIKNTIKHIGLFLLFSLPLIMITWYTPIFEYHLHTPNKISEFDYKDLSSLSAQIEHSWEYFKILLNINLNYTAIFQILFLFGIFALLFNKNRNKDHKYYLILLISMIISINHFFLTMPLLKMNLFPMRIYSGYHVFVYPLISVFGAIAFWRLFLSRYEEYKKYYILALTIILILGSFNTLQEKFDTSYYSYAKEPLPQPFTELQNWFNKNTDINDVFISTNENSFALSALTGRKGVNFRRAHSGMYVDVDQRYLDAGIILYGNDDEKRKKLLTKYNVQYLYWEYNWLSMEFSIDSSGKVMGLSDPLLMIYSQEKEDSLKSSNISYAKMHTWLDPANKKPDTKQYDTILIDPSNYRNAETPWNPSLDKFLSLEKEIIYMNQAFARIYRINIDD